MSILVGNCVELMQRFPDDFFHAIVTDPPYGLKFMGKKWDNAEYGFHREWADQAIRVLKPGGHLLSFGGTRTYHRMASAVEDAGFEIRDMVQWLYGQGFPKSMNVGKAIDKAAGKEREVVGRKSDPRYQYSFSGNASAPMGNVDPRRERDDHANITAPATPEAAQWEGWGTALKPAQEPIVLARKPFKGTVAKNVLEHGVAGLNIDATRIGSNKDVPASPRRAAQGPAYGDLSKDPGTGSGFDPDTGRWPANVILDEQAGVILDEQTGTLKSGTPGTIRGGVNTGAAYGAESRKPGDPMTGFGDSGGASRFFYCAKASRKERNAGLDHLDEKDLFWSSGTQSPGTFQSGGTKKSAKNNHPTVKPIDLMRYLIRLVTPPGGTILDPFIGSGTTGIAAHLEGFRFVGMEMEEEYAAIARARIKHWKENGDAT